MLCGGTGKVSQGLYGSRERGLTMVAAAGIDIREVTEKYTDVLGVWDERVGCAKVMFKVQKDGDERVYNT